MRSLVCSLCALVLIRSVASAETYNVGPGQMYDSLQDVENLLGPGDLVLVEGNATYPGGVWFRNAGDPTNRITIRGVRVNGNRPRLLGQSQVLRIGDHVNHYTIEGFEIEGDSSTFCCIFNGGDQTILRDLEVHNSPSHGILGADISGSLTISHCEVYDTGDGSFDHQIYIGSGNQEYPNATLRIEHCYIHGANGGNNIKSRVGSRTEIYYNWIEGAFHHELELIGADPDVQTSTVREDAEVIGNVIMKTQQSGLCARIGGDSEGASSFGRYRFLNNTFIFQPGVGGSAFRLHFQLGTFEAYNNVFYRIGGADLRIISDATSGPFQAFGSHNWLPNNATHVPPEWVNSVVGTDPGFQNSAAFDFSPTAAGALFNAGLLPTTAPPSGFPEFPNPTGAPAYLPPQRAPLPLGTAVERQISGSVDIGAFEAGTGTGSGSTGAGSSSGSSTAASTTGGGTSTAGDTSTGGSSTGASTASGSTAGGTTGSVSAGGGTGSPGTGSGTTTSGTSSAGGGTGTGSGALALLDWDVVVRAPKPDRSARVTSEAGLRKKVRGYVERTGLEPGATTIVVQLALVTSPTSAPTWSPATKVKRLAKSGRAAFSSKRLAPGTALTNGTPFRILVRASTNFTTATSPTNSVPMTAK